MEAQRGAVLDEAKTIINGVRQDTYGNPEDSFTTIAEFWTTYLNTRFPVAGINLEPKDTTIMMTLFKLAREAHQGKRDNLVDAAGYLGISGDFPAKGKQFPRNVVKDTILNHLAASIKECELHG